MIPHYLRQIQQQTRCIKQKKMSRRKMNCWIFRLECNFKYHIKGLKKETLCDNIKTRQVKYNEVL